MAKNKDIFLDIVGNPQLNLEDLVSVGHSSENTRLLDKSAYENSERVRSMFTDKDGNFKQEEFDNYYDVAHAAYQSITDKNLNKSIINSTVFDADNVWVSPELRKSDTAPILGIDYNPDRRRKNIFRVGRVSDPTLSISELAQAEKVLMNPTEVAKGAKPIYSDAPNDSWWSKFWDTQVLAQYDEDEYDENGELLHQKGEYKLNDNGTYYYEDLDGRDIYGRQVLNKFNTITTDGSFWNQYDFLDSDDLEAKSFAGSVAKNLALVGSMFIPGIGWGVAAASVANQMIGLSGTLGKMLTGSDSPTFSAWEGFAKSFDRRTLKTQESQGKTFTWENFIDLIGDTTAQLREQRAIFKFVPAILKGKYGMDQSEAGFAKLASKYSDELHEATDLSKLNFGKIIAESKKNGTVKNLRQLVTGANNIIEEAADKYARDYFTSYNKLGEQIARAYMTAITVADTYGEAKEAGASDLEATLLTIGYGAAEDRLLRSEIGRWIMPELRGDRQRSKMIAQALTKLDPEIRKQATSLKPLSDETKKDWLKRLFNIGKDICNAEYATASKSLKSVIANGFSEGVEEVSEEALADFSKSCFNVVQQLQGDNTRMNAFNHNWDWQEALQRYGMSFGGGVVGGSINAAASDYKMFKDLSGMTHEQAVQQLVWMKRNGEIEDFWKDIQGMEIGNKNLSTQVDDEGRYKVGTDMDNQDLEAKRAIRANIDLISNLMDAEGASLSDKGLVGQVMNISPKLKGADIVGSFRANALAKSVTAGRLLREYNRICAEIVKLQADINSKGGDKPSDSAPDGPGSNIGTLKQQLKKLQEQKEDILNGNRTAEFYRDALFETNFGISEEFIPSNFETFAERESKKAFAAIGKEELASLEEKYKTWSKSSRSDEVHNMAERYWGLVTQSSAALQQSADMYEQMKAGKLDRVRQLNGFAKAKLDAMTKILQKGDDNEVNNLQELLGNINKPANIVIDGVDNNVTFSDFQKTQLNTEKYEQELQAIIANDTLSFDEKRELMFNSAITNIFNELISVCDESIKAGYINPEVKAILLPAIKKLSDVASDYSAENYYNEELETKYDEISTTLTNLFNTINKDLAYTPIIQNLKDFGGSIGAGKNVLQLLEECINGDALKSLEDFQLEDKSLEMFEEAEKVLRLYRASILGARVDSADVEDMFGYNKVMNQVGKKLDGYVPLAEINDETAKLALLDVNMAIERLNSAKSLHELNSGNKLNSQKKVAVNKNLILYKKSEKFITSLIDDDDIKENWNGVSGNALSALQGVITSMNKHNKAYGDSANDIEMRSLALSPEDRKQLDVEAISLNNALHEFFQDNLKKEKYKNTDGTVNYKLFADDLVKIFDKVGFDLFKKNDEILTQSSLDINDTAFVWWLASKAALSDDQFYDAYRQIIGNEKDANPIAPIATQELGIFAGVAAIVNGNMFNAFGQAMKSHMVNKWVNEYDETKRKEIVAANKLVGVFTSDEEVKTKKLFNGSDLVPNLYNILFIEGIPGSGKSTGVFNSIVKTLNKMDLKLEDGTSLLKGKSIWVGHTTNENAEHLAGSIDFDKDTKVIAKGKKEILSMIGKFRDGEKEDGTYEYFMGEDAYIDEDGVIRCAWELKPLDPSEVPAFLLLDEWSQYTQLEADFVNKFAQTYGVQIITGGDLDQLSPQATVYKSRDDKSLENSYDLSMARGIQPIVTKLGVSMRTGNVPKSYNVNTLQAWRRNPIKDPVNLRYFETEDDLYGDKVYNESHKGISDSALTKIKHDIEKMITNLSADEKIGYIFSDKESPLYKWANEDIRKNKFDFKPETSAQGREARYYVVENNRNPNRVISDSKSEPRSADDYFKSVYTGLSRSEQASIIIAAQNGVGGLKIQNSIMDEKLLKDSFTGDGIKRFSKDRKTSLDEYYSGKTITPPVLSPRQKIEASKKAIDPSVETSGLDPVKKIVSEPLVVEEPEIKTESETESETETEEEPDKESSSEDEVVKPSEEPIKPEEDEISEEPKDAHKYPIGTILYSAETGMKIGTISAYDGKNYKLDGDNSVYSFTFIDKSLAIKPVLNELFKVNDTIYRNGQIYTIKARDLDEDANVWYNTLVSEDGTSLKLSDFTIKQRINSGLYELNPIGEPETDSEYGEVIPVEMNPLEEGTQDEYEEALEQVIAQKAKRDEEEESKVTITDKDIEFALNGETFNTQYVGFTFKDGKPVIDYSTGGENRIDNGHGLYKIDPDEFGTEEALLTAIGKLRSDAMHLPIGKLTKEVQRTLGMDDITVRFAFVSKSKKVKDHFKKGIYSRYYYDPDNRLINMLNEAKAEVPIKTVSMMVQDKNGNAILEIPMVTLSNPMTILYKLYQQDPTNPVAKAFIDARTAAIGNPNASLLSILNTVIDTINKQKPKKSSNLYKLGQICKLYLFTNNGFKFLPERWSLAQNAKNLGSKYVKSRVTDESIIADKKGSGKFDLEAEWNDIDQELLARNGKDLWLSRIMIANNSDYNDTFIVSAGHPFILRTEDRRFSGDDKMMKRYIEQQRDPSLEPIVKLELISPPEESIGDYLRTVFEIVKQQQKKVNFFGNDLTPLKILVAASYDQELYGKIKDNRKESVDKMVNQYKSLFELTKGKKLSVKEKSNIFKQMAAIVKQGNQQETRRSLNDALLDIFSSPAVSEENVVLRDGTHDGDTDADNYLARIEKLALDNLGMTGVLGHCHEIKRSGSSSLIGNFATPIVTDSKNRYAFPGGKSFRIYSKYDSPKFDLTQSLTTIAKLSDDALFEKGIWKFGDKTDENTYLQSGITTKHKERTNKEILIDEYQNLIGKYNFNVDNLSDDISKQEFLNELVNQYTDTPGNLATHDGNDVYFYSLINDDPDNPNQVPDEYQDYEQLSFEPIAEIDNGSTSYEITLRDPSNKEHKIRIDVNPDRKTGKLVLLEVFTTNPKTVQNQPVSQSSGTDLDTLQDYIEKLNNPSTPVDEEFIIGMLNDAANILVSNSHDPNLAMQILRETFADDMDRIMITEYSGIENLFDEPVMTDQTVETDQTEEQEQKEYASCPVTITKQIK